MRQQGFLTKPEGAADCRRGKKKQQVDAPGNMGALSFHQRQPENQQAAASDAKTCQEAQYGAYG